MDVMEFSIRSGVFSKEYALAVTIAVHGAGRIEPQLREAAAALGEWCSRRGAAAKQVVFSVSADPDRIDDCERQLEEAARDSTLSAVLRRLTVHLSLFDLAGNAMKDRPFLAA